MTTMADGHDRVYSDDELREMVKKMRSVSQMFYEGAFHVGVHPFIEFCGLMNKYIDICERSAAQGIDFTMTTVHGEGPGLVVEDHDVRYLAEKFACIFARTMFSNPHMWETFKRSIEREIGSGDVRYPVEKLEKRNAGTSR